MKKDVLALRGYLWPCLGSSITPYTITSCLSKYFLYISFVPKSALHLGTAIRIMKVFYLCYWRICS